MLKQLSHPGSPVWSLSDVGQPTLIHAQNLLQQSGANTRKMSILEEMAECCPRTQDVIPSHYRFINNYSYTLVIFPTAKKKKKKFELTQQIFNNYISKSENKLAFH